MQTLTSSSGSLVRGIAPTHRPAWPVTLVLAAALVVLVTVATISVWLATSDSSTTPPRVVQSTNAAELSVPAAPVVRSANAAEQPTPGFAPLHVPPGLAPIRFR
jgi:hypothetical protein